MVMKWYVIHTQSGFESKLKFAIEEMVRQKNASEKIGEIVVPEIEVEEIKEGKKKKVIKNLYPGYIFIQMDYSEEAWFLIKDIAFARKPAFIGERKRFTKDLIKPSSISEREIDNIKKIMAEGEIKGIASDISYEKGEMVLVKDGPFAGFKAVIDEVKDGKEKLEVLVNIFGRSTPVEVSFSQVEKVED